MEERTHDHTVKRLLGPAEPEILCDECFARIDEYVDLELLGGAADEAIPGMRAHLEGCPACHEEYESLRELARTDGPR
jgi:anti-sigma factor RsiW